MPRLYAQQLHNSHDEVLRKFATLLDEDTIDDNHAKIKRRSSPQHSSRRSRSQSRTRDTHTPPRTQDHFTTTTTTTSSASVPSQAKHESQQHDDTNDAMIGAYTYLLQERLPRLRQGLSIDDRKFVVDEEYERVVMNEAFRDEMASYPDVQWHVLFKAFNGTLHFQKLMQNRVRAPPGQGTRTKYMKAKLHEFNSTAVINKARDELRRAGLSSLPLVVLAKLAMFCHHFDMYMWLVHVEPRLDNFTLDVFFWVCKLRVDARCHLQIRSKDLLAFDGERGVRVSANPGHLARRQPNTFQDKLWQQKFRHTGLIIPMRTHHGKGSRLHVNFRGRKGVGTRTDDNFIKPLIGARGVPLGQAPLRLHVMNEFRVFASLSLKHMTWWCTAQRQNANLSYNWRSMYWLLYMDVIFVGLLANVALEVRSRYVPKYNQPLPISAVMSWRDFTLKLQQRGGLDVPFIDDFLSLLPRINLKDRGFADYEKKRTGEQLTDMLNEAMKVYMVRLVKGQSEFPEAYRIGAVSESRVSKSVRERLRR